MKNLFNFILISFALSANAQKFEEFHENFFRAGAKAGVNINKIRGQKYSEGFAYNFQAGGFLQFNFSDHFGIQPEVNFVQSSAEFTNDANSVYDDVFLGGSQHKAKLNYLEVPILLNVNLGPTKKVKFQIGPSYGAVLKQTVDSVKAGGNLYKNGEFSAISGLWLQLGPINLSGRYKLGLSNVSDIAGHSWHNQAFQIGAGLTF